MLFRRDQCQKWDWDWDKMLFRRDQCQNMKMKNCRNYQNLSYAQDDVRAVAAEALIPAAAALVRLNNQMMHSIVMLLWDILLDLDDLSPSTSRYYLNRHFFIWQTQSLKKALVQGFLWLICL
jgi:hypothetical protein